MTATAHHSALSLQQLAPNVTAKVRDGDLAKAQLALLVIGAALIGAGTDRIVLRALLGEEHRAVGAGNALAQVDHFQACKRCVITHVVFLLGQTG